MDLSKSFDSLPHELILTKLHVYGTDIDSLEFLQDYLSNRTQRVKLDFTFSSRLKILLGISQGFILGSLFFSIFLNNILWFIEKTDICNFANENTIYNSFILPQLKYCCLVWMFCCKTLQNKINPKKSSP